MGSHRGVSPSPDCEGIHKKCRVSFELLSHPPLRPVRKGAAGLNLREITIVDGHYGKMPLRIPVWPAGRPARVNRCPTCRSEAVSADPRRVNFWTCSECGKRFVRRLVPARKLRTVRPSRIAQVPALVAWLIALIILSVCGGLALTMMSGPRKEDATAERVE